MVEKKIIKSVEMLSVHCSKFSFRAIAKGGGDNE